MGEIIDFNGNDTKKEKKKVTNKTIIIWLLFLLFFLGYGVVSFYFDIYNMIFK